MIKIGEIRYAEIKEYAKLKMVTQQTVYNWIKEKRVETKTLFGRTLIKM